VQSIVARPSPALPPLHDSANDASGQAQREHLRLIRISLVLLVVGAGTNVAGALHAGLQPWLLWAAAIMLLVSMILSFVVRERKADRTWFAARALAESVKSMSWRYMTRAEPYHAEPDPGAVDAKFREDLKRLIEAEKDVFGSLRPPAAGAMQITSDMRRIRLAPLEERLQLYLDARIKDQQTWYARQAERNQRNARLFFWLTIAAQGLAVVSAFWLAGNPDLKLRAAPVFAALAAALVAWTQLRRHDELAKAYALAAHELAIILSLAESLSTDEELGRFAKDAENAVSREHTLWLARRDLRQRT
jgi:hypothetical protein